MMTTSSTSSLTINIPKQCLNGSDLLKLDLRFENQELWEEAELDQIVNMDRIPNTVLFGFWKFYEYRIIQFLKINEYRILISTIWPQLFEYQILKIEL